MTHPFARTIVDPEAYARSVAHFRETGVRLPSFSELAAPARIDGEIQTALNSADPDGPDPLNLFRVHWYNAEDRQAQARVPGHIVVPEELSGVDAKIIVALGDRFPMISAHKVLAAYACLVPRLVTGEFDISAHKAVWPSTGNYCRGGVAISRILGCRSVAVLPEGMSIERFQWLEKWSTDPADIVRTPGSESNLKEIYDACHVLASDPQNVILNQFSEFGNYVVHRYVTGPAMEAIFESVKGRSDLAARAWVCASGSGGTLAAGDYLKAKLGAEIAAVEALECPTLLCNGYGEHNIQGIGDKHVPLIHNVYNTDYVIAVSDRSTDKLNLLFNSEVGKEFLRNRKNVPTEIMRALPHLGLSSIANVLAAIKLVKFLGLRSSDAVLTVATDGAPMYSSQLQKTVGDRFGGAYDDVAAAQTFGEHLMGVRTDAMLELTRRERDRIFNLGYYTWVEQQGVSLEDFDRRRDRTFWDGLMDIVPLWDEMITRFNTDAR